MTVLRRPRTVGLKDIPCQKCGEALTTRLDGKIKLRNIRLVAFDKETGEAEIVCPHCKRDTRVAGLRLSLDA